MGERLVVGFDLDLTLLDPRAAFADLLDVLAAEHGVSLPSAELTERLGPPLDLLLGPYLPAEAVPGAVDRFRALYPDVVVGRTPALPGAHEALAAVHRNHGDVLVVTGKFTRNARLHLDHLGLAADDLVGEVWGAGKGPALAERGASIYVGDHVHDVEGARAAGALSVSVLTGGCTEAELREAGTDVVLGDLTAFADWLEEHLLETRLSALEADLRTHDRLMVAYSGGADSAFLLAAAARALGPDHVVAATAYSDSLPLSEREPALAVAADLGVRVVTPTTHEMERAGYRANDGDRCAFCKAELLDVLGPLAEAEGCDAVATGTNADDAVAGFRPGIAAAAERGAVTPLRDAGLTKAQVRAASRRWDLPTWDKPAAACLSSRVAYGIEISPARLARVERAEAAVRRALPQVRDVRVRDLGGTARIEVDRDLVDAVGDGVLAAVRAAGFESAEVDPLGFRSGSMNTLLSDPEVFR